MFGVEVRFTLVSVPSSEQSRRQGTAPPDQLTPCRYFEREASTPLDNRLRSLHLTSSVRGPLARRALHYFRGSD